MAEKQNTPEIRFEGFTDPWEQRKFSDIVDVCSGKDYKHLEEGPIPVYGTGGFMTSVDEALSYDRDAVGIGRKGTIDKPYLLKAPFWTVDTLFYAIPKPDMDLEFVHCSFLNVDWKSKDESTGLPSLSKEAINETIALVPSFNEQSRIGEFFNGLDFLITLHQRKYDKLCTVKKSMLDKMFPKPGETEPEIRFEGFTDPWEQRKFSELYVINNERNEGCEFGYDKTLSVATMTYNGGNGAADNSLSTYKVVRVGDIAFEGHTNKEHAYGRFVLNDAGDGLMSPRFSCLRPIVEQRYSFWKHYIPRESMMRPVLVNATKSGTMMNELVPADLMRESILVPALYEQEAIGRFFKQLDDLITLHQRKLDLLKNTKKSLLDKMFV
ncbi:restriction endonuclease subunit S [Olsenella uli]|uniref:restriction endonuclease subunit S n=2 Tax=Actinomycetota TaxID=201174 RepID=UPI003D7948F0